MDGGTYRDSTTGRYYNNLAEYTAAQNQTQRTGIQDAFQSALNALQSSQGAAEKSYQTGKRKTLSDIAMSNIQSGMANTTNMASAGTAYDQANRSSFDAAIGGQTASLYSDYANTLTNLYNTNLNYQTNADQLALQNAGNTSRSQVSNLGSQVSALQSYIQQLASSSSGSRTKSYDSL